MHKLFAILAATAFTLLSFVRLGGAQSQWNEIVEAAKREGCVVVVGPQGNETREALTVGFQKKYPEIKVEHSGSAGAQLWSYKNDAGEVRHVAVLGVSPINSAYDAVRAYIVSESQKQSKPS